MYPAISESISDLGPLYFKEDPNHSQKTGLPSSISGAATESLEPLAYHF